MSAAGVPRNNRILVVDDNPAIHEDFRKVLAANAKATADLDLAEDALFGESTSKPVADEYELSFASQGQEALAKVEAAVAGGSPYAMAFVDVRMPPGWDGIETTIHLWKVAPDMQIVICTAYSDYSWDEMVEKVGQSDRLVILKKPFDNVEVLQLASALTEKWRLQQEAKLRLDELEAIINSRTQELKQSIMILQQNIANYQRSEERLRKSEERFKLIAENAADLIMVLDTTGVPEYFSPSVRLTLGHELDGLRKQSVFDLLHQDDRERTAACVSACINTGSCQTLEFKLRHKSGAWRDVEARICSIREKSEDKPHLVLVGRDLSAQKEMESQTAFLTRRLLDAEEGKPLKQNSDSLADRLESPLKSLSARIQFVHDAFQKLTPLLEQQKQIAEAAAADVDAGTADLKQELPRAITESLANVETINQMIADLRAGI